MVFLMFFDFIKIGCSTAKPALLNLVFDIIEESL